MASKVIQKEYDGLVCGMNRGQLDQMAKDVVSEMNKARENPKYLIPLFEERLKKFIGTSYQVGEQELLRTKEGSTAVKNAIEYLKKVEPCEPLEWKDELMLSSRDHVLDLGPKGTHGHDSTDGSKYSDRILRHGQYISCSGENISFGASSAFEIICRQIIDDGVPTRGHRLNIFNNKYKTIGVYAGYHLKYGIMTVMDFAGGIAPLGSNIISGEASKRKEELKTQMDDFSKEEIKDFPEVKGFSKWKGSVRTEIEGKNMIKTVTRKYQMPNGKEQVVTKIYIRPLQ